MKTPFTLRKWAETDAEQLTSIANNKKIAQFMTDRFPHPYQLENAHAFITMAGQSTSIFAIDIEGKVVGGVGLHPQTDIQQKNMEIGYWLAEPLWGQGMATQAVQQIVTYGFDTFPEVNRIFGRVFGNNPASAKVLQKAGFVLEATFEKTLVKYNQEIDELIFGMRRG